MCERFRKYLNASLEKDKDAEHNYNWTMIELYDQTTRNYSGGKMGEYLQSNMPKFDNNCALNHREIFLEPCGSFKGSPRKHGLLLHRILMKIDEISQNG